MKFKVGDKVRVLCGAKKGMTGEVIKIHNAFIFDTRVSFGSCAYVFNHIELEPFIPIGYQYLLFDDLSFDDTYKCTNKSSPNH